MPVNVIDQYGQPVELAPGRGDLRYTSTGISGSIPDRGSIALIGDETRSVSYARLVSEQPWIAAAVMRLVAWGVRVPLKAYKRTGSDSRERLAPKDHRLARALVDPWEHGSQADLVSNLLGPTLVHGNSLTEVQEGAGGRIRFLPADWRYTRPIRPWRASIAGWYVDTDENERVVGSDQMMHMAWWSPLGPLGISPLHQLGVSLRIEDAAQRHQQSYLGNSARSPSVVTADDGFLGIHQDERKEILDNLRADITTLYAGPDNSGRPVLLPPGLKWDDVGHTAVEAELINQRKVAREEIAGVYRITPGTMGMSEAKALNDERQASLMDGLVPALILIEQALNAQLVRALLREEEVYVAFDLAGILRGDRLKEVEAMREAIGTALLTPNEGRAALDMPTSLLPQMDDYYMPRNNIVSIAVPYDGTPSGSAGPVTNPDLAPAAAAPPAE